MKPALTFTFSKNFTKINGDNYFFKWNGWGVLFLGLEYHLKFSSVLKVLYWPYCWRVCALLHCPCNAARWSGVLPLLHCKKMVEVDIINCYIPRLSFNKTSTVIGWFLVTWSWSNYTVSRPGHNGAIVARCCLCLFDFFCYFMIV